MPSRATRSVVNEYELWCHVAPSASAFEVTVSPKVHTDRPHMSALPPPSRPTMSGDCASTPTSRASRIRESSPGEHPTQPAREASTSVRKRRDMDAGYQRSSEDVDVDRSDRLGRRLRGPVRK